MPRWKSIPDAASELGVSVAQLNAAIRAGKIPVLALSRRTRRVDMDAIKPLADAGPTQRQVTRIQRGLRTLRGAYTDYLGD